MARDPIRRATYQSYRDMLRRVDDPKQACYKNYGGRGIGVCKRWREGFKMFLGDMGLKPTLKHTIERIDNEKGYSPENCRWATRLEQNQNTRANRNIEFEGTTLCLSEWARRIGIDVVALMERLDRSDWSLEEALTTPPIRATIIPYKGETKTIQRWATEYGVSAQVIRYRLSLGWSFKKILESPVYPRLKKLHHEGLELTVKQAAKRFGIGYTTLLNRLNKGWSVHKALTTKKK